MKRTILFITLVSIFSFWACETEEEIEPTKVEATISGENWLGYDSSAEFSDTHFSLSSTSHEGTTIGFKVKGTSIGGYNLIDTALHIAYFKTNMCSESVVYNSSQNTPEGIVRITNIDTKNQLVSGFFFFIAWHPTDPIYENISNGVFRQVPYTRVNQD